jgi:flagellar basal body rod protein FlgG
LEASNVQLPLEMTNMMMALRAYAANQQVISSVSETTSRLIDQVGGQ